MNALKKWFSVGFLNKGPVPIFPFGGEQWDSHLLKKTPSKQNLWTAVQLGREYTLKWEENASGISSKERRENNDEGRKEKRKNISFESTQEFAFRERNWPVACSEGKAVVRHTYLYLCNLAYRNLLLS